MSAANVRQLIAAAEAEGVRIRLDEKGRVRVRGVDQVVARWGARLKEAKKEIAGALAAIPPKSPSDPEDAQGAQGAQPAGVSAFSEMEAFGRSSGLVDALKGNAVLLVLDSTGERCWIVADEEDAAALGTVDGAVFTRREIQILVAIKEPEIKEDLMRFKQSLSGRLHVE